LHIVTKFLVFVAAILAVLLSGLSIAYTSNAGRLRAAIQTERDAAAEARAVAMETNAAAQVERQSLEEARAALQAELASLKQTMAALQGDNAALLAENKRLELTTASYQARIDQFTAIIDAFAKLDEARSNELAALREKELKRAIREIELSDRINDLTGQIDVSTETNRRLQEDLVAIRQELDRARSGETTIAASGKGTLRAPIGFRGRVVSIDREASGSVLVSIDGGSTDGLGENMKLIIVRGSQFIATVVLTRVDLNESVGLVDFLGREGQVEVLPGDLVQPTVTDI